MAGHRAEQQEGLAEGVEWELVADLVPDAVEATRVAGQAQLLLPGNSATVDRVGGSHPGTVLVQPGREELYGVVEQRVGAGRGGRLAGVALVPDPYVAVVVVAARLRSFRQARGRRCHHAARRTGQSAQYGEGLPGVPSTDGVSQLWHLSAPRGLRVLPD